MSQLRVCILNCGQAAQLERQGVVPKCGWHRHCSESKADQFLRSGEACKVQPAKGCRHARPAIVMIEKRDYRVVPTALGISVHGAPQLRTWQLVP
jgi:hypothetical protein